MNASRIRFSLISVCMHLAVFWLLWQDAGFNYGAASNLKSSGARSSVLTMKFLPVEDVRQPDVSVPAAEKIPVLSKNDMSQGTSAAALREHADHTGRLLNPAPSDRMPAVHLPVKFTADSLRDEGYFNAGMLTRLPAPLVEIDLDELGLDDVPVAGKIDMTLLIDASGAVIDVIALPATEDLRTFSEQVADRFRNALFTPGEISGKAVKSLLQITVVSESLPMNGN
jgi:hypothetical protein